MLQGRQGFNLVNPTTKETVGKFDALVTAENPIGMGSSYVELLVTANYPEVDYFNPFVI